MTVVNDLPEGWLFLSATYDGPDSDGLFVPAAWVPTRYRTWGKVRLGTETFVDFREALKAAGETVRSINSRIERTLMEVE